MTTYYEILHVLPTAQAAEIQTAYETQYNYWRRLVTHHNPEVVNKANQALQVLEKVRTILTDPKSRATYDASIGLDGLTGGLVDPHAGPRPVVPSPPPPQRRQAHAPTTPVPSQRVDAWICPKCQNVNALYSRFCKKCGQTIGINCPECNSVIESIASFCPSCGTNVPRAMQRRELEALLLDRQTRLALWEQSNPRRDAEVKQLRSTTVSAGAWMSLGLAFAVSSVVTWFPTSQADPYYLYAYSLYDYSPVLSFMVFGAQLVFVITLAVVRRAFSFSAFVACVAGLAATVVPRETLIEGGIFLISTMVITAALILSSRLGRYGGWVWGLAVLVVVSVVASVLFSPLVYVFYSSDTFVLVINSGIHILQAFLFGLLCVRAWWLTHRIERQVAVALADKQNQLKALQSEIWKLSREIEALRH